MRSNLSAGARDTFNDHGRGRGNVAPFGQRPSIPVEPLVAGRVAQQKWLDDLVLKARPPLDTLFAGGEVVGRHDGCVAERLRETLREVGFPAPPGPSTATRRDRPDGHAKIRAATSS
jgi:hypothetical protein